MSLYSPMEQYEIYTILGVNFEINQIVFYLLISTILIISLNYLLTDHLISNYWTILIESLYRTILVMVENYLGYANIKYFPLIFTIFHLILFSNFLGLIPYSSTSTVEFAITLTISFTLLIGILIIGFLNHQFFLFAVFLPAGTPFGLIPFMIFLEVIAYFTRLLSLGLRLSVNMITGHILTKVCINFIWLGYINGTSFLILIIPFALLTLFLSLEILIAYLQAYIFTFITCITFRDLL